ncbi:MAG: tripartite tricarboxylate transporter substrate binding protein [Xanthobacteraceae bacterium]|jgi:tripartite-type tricarboxylate transporter receptor subunit TctC
MKCHTSIAAPARLAVVVMLALVAGRAAAAVNYPAHIVKLLCWSSAGAPLDVMMRQVGRQLGAVFGQPFIVENRPGGEGAVAMAAVMNQPADGYTVLSTTSSMSFAMATGEIEYGPDGFTVLPALQAEPSAIAVRADSPLKTMKQFMDYIHDHSDKMSVGGFSSAGFHQYVFYRLQQAGQFKAIWVPFRGGQDAALALLSGVIDAAVMTPSSAIAQIQHGDIRLLGISAAQRSEYFPDVPTFKEQGYDIVESIWRGVMVRSDTPREVVDRLMTGLEKMKQSKEWQDFSRLTLQSPVDISLDAMQQQVRNEVVADREFLAASGLRKDSSHEKN